MPTRDHYPEGVPCWVDLSTTDVNTAVGFYERLFGWEIRKAESDSTPYWMAYRKGRSAAGIGPAQDEAQSSAWTTYFAVDDVDATVRKIGEAGGSVLFEPADIMDLGRMAIATDVTGAMFAMWQAGLHHGAGIVNEHGGLNWNELQTDDVPRALDFYAAVFGHTAEKTEGGSGPYYVISAGERPVAGAMPKPAPEIPNSWGVYFAVDDVEEALGITRDEGGTHVYGPIEAEGAGTFLGITDPTGAHLTLIQLSVEVD